MMPDIMVNVSWSGENPSVSGVIKEVFAVWFVATLDVHDSTILVLFSHYSGLTYKHYCPTMDYSGRFLQCGYMFKWQRRKSDMSS